MLYVHPRLFLFGSRTISNSTSPLQPRCTLSLTQPTQVRNSKLQLNNGNSRVVSHPRSTPCHSTTAISNTNNSLTSRARRSCQNDREHSSNGVVAGTARWFNGRIRYRSSCSNGTSSSSCESVADLGAGASRGTDNAAVLLRMAKYIEEDRSAADKLAEVVSTKCQVRIPTSTVAL